MNSFKQWMTRHRRKLLPVVIVALFLGVGMTGALPSVAAQINDASANSANIRVGKLVAWDSATMSVMFTSGADETVVTGIPYIKTVQPTLGDYVLVQVVGSQWIVTGSMSYNYTQNNVIQNFDFSADGPGSILNQVPSYWSWVHEAGSNANNTTVNIGFLYGNGDLYGNSSVYINVNDTSGTGDQKLSNDSLYSSPFTVYPGELWSAGASVALIGVNLTGQSVAPLIADVYLQFYANASDAVTAPVSTWLISEYAAQAPGGGFYLIAPRGGAAKYGIPATNGVTVGRLRLRSQALGHQTVNTYPTIVWAGAFARKIKNADGTYATQPGN